jgi:hypothetical protein
MKNKKTILWIFIALLFIVIIAVFLNSAINIGNAVSILKNKPSDSIQLTGIVITNPEENGMSFYYGTPIKFTAKPIFSGQQQNYPALPQEPRFVCKWTLVSIGNNPDSQILNPEPVINDCSLQLLLDKME